jgi:hypothetical protein
MYELLWNIGMVAMLILLIFIVLVVIKRYLIKKRGQF